jgi:vitamin B12/bleomycin/antimicrobial peptide transport system ATP-binding/permease protein
MTAERIPLDRLLWVRRTTAAFFRSPDAGRSAIQLSAALVVLMLLISAMNVLNSYVGRDFMTSIEQRDSTEFALMGLLYVAVFAGSTLFAVLFRFCEERLGLLWRQWLTRCLVLDYLGIGTPYRLREEGEIENPDQRIGDDARTFTTTTLSFVLMVLNGTVTIVAFSGVLWSITPYLFAATVAYAAIGSLAAFRLGRPLIALSFAQSDREASFRADLVHVRANAESVALLRREGRLRTRLLRRVDAVTANTRRMIAVNRNLSFFTTGYNYLIQIIPALIVGPLFMRGLVEFGVITQAAMAFSHLIGAFSLIVTQFASISSYAAVLTRLGSLSEGMHRASTGSPIELIEERDGRVKFDHLTLRSPGDGRVLVADLDLEIHTGTRVLVAGPNHAGKVALFRAAAGVWSAGEGRIRLPEADHILFVAERPYLPPGTLREALLRTGSEFDHPDDGRIRDVLSALGLDAVVERAGGLDVERDWDDLLALGEQQLVVIARIVLAQPRFAMLHRIDTTLTPDQVARTLRLLTAASVTAIALGEDDGSRSYDALLWLDGDGSWKFEAAPHADVHTGGRVGKAR